MIVKLLETTQQTLSSFNFIDLGPEGTYHRTYVSSDFLKNKKCILTFSYDFIGERFSCSAREQGSSTYLSFVFSGESYDESFDLLLIELYSNDVIEIVDCEKGND